MNNQDHISESFEKIIWFTYLNSLMQIRDGPNLDPGWKKWDPGSGICNTVWDKSEG
jgi:hypothetical protein